MLKKRRPAVPRKADAMLILRTYKRTRSVKKTAEVLGLSKCTVSYWLGQVSHVWRRRKGEAPVDDPLLNALRKEYPERIPQGSG